MGDKPNQIDTLVVKTSEAIELIEAATTSWRKDLHDVQEKIDAIAEGKTGMDKDQVRELLDEALNKQDNERITNRVLHDSQRVALSIPDPWSDSEGYFQYGLDPAELSRRSIEQRDPAALSLICGLEPRDDMHKALCRMAVDVQILDSIGKAKGGAHYAGFAATFPKTAAKWAFYQKRFYQHSTQKAQGDAMDTGTAASLGNWVPTGWSTEIRELIMLRLRVAALFQRFNMPNTPFELPINLTDTYGNFVPETTDITNPYGTSGIAGQIQKMIGEMKQFNARKLRARMMTSGELVEDALVAMLPMIRNQIVRILANTQEYAVINGQRSGGIDTGYSAGAYDPREAWDGLRKIANARGHEVDCGATYTLTNMLSARKELGESGVELGDLAYVASPIGYLNVIGISEVLTVDKYGEGATVRTGEQGAIAGIPLIISRYVPENLNISGVYDGSTTTSTIINLCRTDAFLIGDKRNVSVEQERIIQTDQFDVVGMQRMDFQPLFTQDAASVDVPVCVNLYDLLAS